jgi:hypothetical protein
VRGVAHARTCRAAAIAVALGGVLIALTPEAAGALQTGSAPRGPEIEAVRFVGARSLDESILRNAIVTRPTTCRNILAAPFCLIGDYGWAEVKQHLPDTAQISADAERLETIYEVWGFPDAVAEGFVLERDDGDAIVEFRIREGRPLVVASIEVRGLESYAPPIRLPTPLPLAPGQPYALPRLEATQELIRARLAERGQPYAQIEVTGDIDEAARRATLALTVTPGPVVLFGPVSVHAEPPLTERTILGRLAYAPGDTFRPSALERSERLLYDLPVIERAAVLARGLERGDPAIATEVVADARRLHGVQVEGTISSTDCLEVGVFWQHRHFLGRPRLFAIGGGVSNLFAAQANGGFPCSDTGTGEFGDLDHTVQAEVWQPSLFGHHRNTLRATAFFRRESSPNVSVERGYGVRLAVARDVGSGFNVRASAAAERNALDAAAIYFCGNYGVCTAAGVKDLTSERWLAPVELLGIWRSAEVPADVRRQDRGPGTPWEPQRIPDWRYVVSAALEGAGGATGSDYDYARAIVEASATRLVGRNGELAAHLRAGAVSGDDVLPPQIRLYSGGPATVRGLPQNLLGPTVLVASRGEPPAQLCAPDARSCDAPPVDPEAVTVRPTGGDRVAEANVEARVWLTSALQLAAFADFGRVWQRSGAALGALPVARSGARLTPGIGIRVITDIGPIRLDLGYDPGGPRTLPVVVADDDGDILHIGNARFDPYGRGDPGFLREALRRLQFHMAIGQAFQ